MEDANVLTSFFPLLDTLKVTTPHRIRPPKLLNLYGRQPTAAQAIVSGVDSELRIGSESPVLILHCNQPLTSVSRTVTMPVTTFDFKEKYRYLNGFNSHLE